MTQVAFQLRVLAFQLERALLVRFTSEQGGLEAHLVMTRAAIRASSASLELAVVDVFVAIAAHRMRHGRAEIRAFVTLLAVGCGMFPVERELGFVVTKAAGRKHRFPARSGMATLARTLERDILKSASVRIRMAILAIRKSQTLVARRGFPGLGTMALGAAYVFMKSSEGESRPEVAKSLGWLPGILIVATQTFRAKLAGVLILMTTEALRAQPQIGLVEVLDLDFAAGRRPDMRGVVTLLASQLAVFSFEGEPGGCTMVEFLTVQFGDRKLPPVVLHVTVSAIGLIRGGVIDAGVITSMFFHTPADLNMTV
jgi:hypothetical protein